MDIKYEFNIMWDGIYNNVLVVVGLISIVFIYYVSIIKINIVKYTVVRRSNFFSIYF